MNRPDISRLHKNRSIYLKLGFICSLSFMLFAFNWTSDFYVPHDQPIVTDTPEEIMVRTIQPKEKTLPPPPVVSPTPEPILKDFEVTTEPIPEKIDEAIPDLPELDPEEVAPAPVAIPAPLPLPPPPTKNAPVEEIFEVVEEMPRFPGCEDQDLSKADRKKCADEAMLQYIYGKVKYPELARRNSIEGMAVVRFIIEKDGRITDLEIVRNPGGGLGQESFRVVKTMPPWIPGKQRGKNVRVKYNLPIRFRLDG